MPQFRYARSGSQRQVSRDTDAVSDVGQTGLDTLHVLGWNRRTQLIQHGICWGSTIVHIHESRADHTESSIDARTSSAGGKVELVPNERLAWLLAPLAVIHHTRLPAISPVAWVCGLAVGPTIVPDV
jgi:hypothetical protein